MRFTTLIRVAAASALSILGCSAPTASETPLRAFPVYNLEGVLTRSGVSFDSTISSDGNGSLRIAAQETTTVRLYETGDLDVEDALLIYRARLRTKDVRGRAYLEMWCHFPGKGEFFSRALAAPLSGTTEWASQETHFSLKRGENPDNVKLNLVIEGAGSVWIDDIALVTGPLG